MSSAVIHAARSLQKALSDFDPASLPLRDCVAVAEQLAATEKACGAARLLAAARAVGGRVHEARGFPDGASWLAHHTGDTKGHAKEALKAAASLEESPRTKSALLAGEVSLAQAEELSASRPTTPEEERELLELARSSHLSKLRERARDLRLARIDRQDLHRRQQQARRFRHFRDRLGMICLDVALPPVVGVPILHRLEAATQRLRREAKGRAGCLESYEAHAADAFCELVSSRGPRGSGGTELVIVCDLYALRRGHLHPGEACHILGGGPIPVRLASELKSDAFLKAVLHDGVAIHTIKHFGRRQPAELRTALNLGLVPAFSGARCADCGSHFGLEYDHVNPVANGGPTEYSNLEPRCWKDHRHKTEQDRKAGLLGSAPRHGPP